MSSSAEEGLAIEPWLVAIRRDLHAFPELSRQEERTASKIQGYLVELGLAPEVGIAGHGIVVEVDSGRPGPIVGLRADMDALPVVENSDASYVSRNYGVMHACGHDAHTAMLLGAVRLLVERKDWQGRILAIFQPAEEDAPAGGAQAMIESGMFYARQPDSMFALHVWPGLPVGTVAIPEGALTSSTDRFTVHFNGTGGHASRPHEGRDALIAAVQFVNQVQTVVSRSIDPIEPAVVGVGQFVAGEAPNILASTAVVRGTIRTRSPEVREVVKQAFRRHATAISTAFDVEARLELVPGYPQVDNSPTEVRMLAGAADEIGLTVCDVRPGMIAEDFSRFLYESSGAMALLGCAAEGNFSRLHDPSFELDEACLTRGASLLFEGALAATRQ